MTEEGRKPPPSPADEASSDAARDEDPPGQDATISSDIPKPPSKVGVTTEHVADDVSPKPSKITLADIQETFPPESSEERVVMDHIERTNPTVGDDEEDDYEVTANGGRIYKAPKSGLSTKSASVSSLLEEGTALPPELVESLHREKLEEMKAESRRAAMERSKSRFTSNSSDKTSKRGGIGRVEDELFELTHQLRPNEPYGLGSVEEKPEGGDDEDEGNQEMKPLTQAEQFRANAAGLFHSLTKNVNETRNSMFGSTNESGEESDGSKHGKSSWHSNSLKMRENLKEIERIVQKGRGSIKKTIRNTMLILILPCTLVAFFLFYVLDNPGAVIIFVPVETTAAPGNETATGEMVRVVSNEQPSFSWLFLFFGVRQVITFNLAVGLQYLAVTYYSQAGINFMFAGPMTRLLIIQAKGWPMIMIFLGILDLAMLFGKTRFANHWLYYQGFLGIFNADNPSGNFPDFDIYKNIVIFTLCSGIAVALKRFFIGLRFGQSSYSRYADRLSAVLKNVLQINRVSRLPEMKNEYISKTRTTFVEEAIECNIWLEKHAYVDHEAEGKEGEESEDAQDTTVDASGNVRQSLDLGSFHQDILSSAQQLKIDDLLGEWEEIDLADKTSETPDLSAIVQFGSSLGLLGSRYPFGQAFGRAETRHQVIECAQDVYADLLKLQQRLNLQQVYEKNGGLDPKTTLKFHTLSIIAMDDIGGLDMKLAKELMHVFRPSREGDISLVEFVKSIDTQYKEMRKLRASVANEGKMNAGTEKIINVVFYFVLVFALLAALGLDPVVVFGGLAAFIISFSFCVSGASSDYIRGLLFILVQRPYDIGDCISIAAADAPASGNGSPQWTVKDLGLYHTTVVFNFSNEIGTISNGAIAQMRVLNESRSPRGNLHFFLKFGIRVKLETVEIFKTRLFDYVKSKPREWLRPCAFRLSLIAADMGYCEYFVLLTHRESWNSVGAMKTSLSDVQQFCFKLTAELDMGYESPPLPVHMLNTPRSKMEQMLDSTNSRLLLPPGGVPSAATGSLNPTGSDVNTTPHQHGVDPGLVDA